MTPILECWQHRGRVVCVPRILVGQHDRRAPRLGALSQWTGTRWRCGVAECHLQQDYGYALSPIGGILPYPILDNNGSNWDLMVVTHETGTTAAPHTHNVGIDQCGCDYGAVPVIHPRTAPAQLGVATIMSYCHFAPVASPTCVWSSPHIESDYLIPAINNASCVPVPSLVRRMSTETPKWALMTW